MFLELFVSFSNIASIIFTCKFLLKQARQNGNFHLFYSFSNDFQIAKLSRSLRVPGDTGNKGKTERKPTPNLNASVKTETQIPNPVSTTPTYQTEQGGNQEELEDDLEEGGLC